MSTLLRFLKAPTVVTIAIAILTILAQSLSATISKQPEE